MDNIAGLVVLAIRVVSPLIVPVMILAMVKQLLLVALVYVLRRKRIMQVLGGVPVNV